MCAESRFKWNLELSTSNPQPVKWKRRDLLWEIAETGEIFAGRSLGEIVETGSILPDEAFARKDNPTVNDKRPVPGVVMITGAAFHEVQRRTAETLAQGIRTLSKTVEECIFVSSNAFSQRKMHLR